MDLEASKKKVAALTAPRNTVLVGASDRPGSWAARVWRNLNRYEFPGPIYLINPGRKEIWDQPCYPDFKSLPEPPDHMVVLVPAKGVIETLRAGAAAGARSATVFSAGFGESFDQEAALLGRQLACESPVLFTCISAWTAVNLVRVAPQRASSSSACSDVEPGSAE